MWPWEHLAFGYLLYWLTYHGLFRERVTGSAALLLAVGTLLPDLIDKPLLWSLHLLPGGVLAHTLVVAVPLGLLVIVIASRLGSVWSGIAFAIGYWSHLIGDVIYPVVLGKGLAYRFLLWPFVPHEPTIRGDFFGNVVFYFTRYSTELMTSRGLVYFSMELTGLSLAILLWLVDGRPGVGTLMRLVRPSIQVGSNKQR